MKLRSGRRYATTADFDDDSADSEDSDYTTIDPSQAATSAGPSTKKKIAKPPRRVQKGKPLPKPSKKGHATSQPAVASTSCPGSSTCASTAAN
ncbi:hypothetical protein ACE6H2_018270 [Prunus campanulata]